MIDPGIGQGRPHHEPERDLGLVKSLLILIAPWLVVALLVWATVTYL